MQDIALKLEGVSKQFGVDVAVHELNLGVARDQVLALVGPSGCGKTTALRLIAGFERPDFGAIWLENRIVSDPYTFLPPEKRGVGMVFQDYALFPHMTVFENVAFGLQAKSGSRPDQRVKSMLTLVGLETRAERYPHELSGGERQRIALARALVPEPVLLLLDEPFSNLDADLRLKMREDVRVILKGIHATAIFVTHDQEEALYMGDRLAVMNVGRIEQLGSPEDIFHRPQTRFVAEFMGNTDFLPARVVANGLETEIGVLPQKIEAPLDTAVEIAMRADDVSFAPEAGGNALILARQFRGVMNFYRLKLPSGRLLHAYAPHTQILPAGTRVRVWADPGHPLAVFHDSKAISPNN
ncbi:MAG: ABC transporter ATP-binding protein [Chloroflexi bacterium]|nr:ABC transporter ATP-binding protein [Chloroflexota bacterium]MQC26006.1 ABC transporter ATP-binding protein [Chloroflexota bacterium]